MKVLTFCEPPLNIGGRGTSCRKLMEVEELENHTWDLIATTSNEAGAADAVYVVAEGIPDTGSFSINASDLNESLSEAGTNCVP